MFRVLMKIWFVGRVNICRHMGMNANRVWKIITVLAEHIHTVNQIPVASSRVQPGIRRPLVRPHANRIQLLSIGMAQNLEHAHMVERLQHQRHHRHAAALPLLGGRLNKTILNKMS